ncbi:hypothetical protein [Algicola sagamiensis]|uniref:hypothetical protein n=1 Tax=Algicola sagamiensis TaxID=163869 RepID=UPI000378181D|nr:hypothetical protein [Algicola sagamiensis]
MKTLLKTCLCLIILLLAWEWVMEPFIFSGESFFGGLISFFLGVILLAVGAIGAIMMGVGVATVVIAVICVCFLSLVASLVSSLWPLLLIFLVFYWLYHQAPQEI